MVIGRSVPLTQVVGATLGDSGHSLPTDVLELRTGDPFIEKDSRRVSSLTRDSVPCDCAQFPCRLMDGCLRDPLIQRDGELK
jgi:hypothetical protein